MLMPPPLKATRPADEVIAAFVALRGTTLETLLSRSSHRTLTRARHELMWLLRDLTHLSLAEIGELLGGRDATTVRHGIDQATDRIAQDEAAREIMLRLRSCILQPKREGLPPDLCLSAVRSVLADSDLTDAEARTAALQLMGARHG